MAAVELRFRVTDERRLREVRDGVRGPLRDALDALLERSPPTARLSGGSRAQARKRGQALGQRIARECGIPAPLIVRCDEQP